jgi:hypothetical protein
MSNPLENHLVNKEGRGVVFGVVLIEVMEINAYPNGSLIFLNRDRIRHLRFVGNMVN